jgi:hypothetical protein
MVFVIGLEVIGQAIDTRGEQGNLHFGRARIARGVLQPWCSPIWIKQSRSASAGMHFVHENADSNKKMLFTQVIALDSAWVRSCYSLICVRRRDHRPGVLPVPENAAECHKHVLLRSAEYRLPEFGVGH